MLLSSTPSTKQFLGSEIETSLNDSKVVILPIPYEATTTYRQGCKHGPSAILEASDQLEVYDEELKIETGIEVGIYTESPIADSRQERPISAGEMLEATKEAVSKLIARDKFVIALGGEHSISAGVVKAYREMTSEPFTVIQIDAHGDLRHEYHDSIHNHACVMRRILEMGLPILPVGIRSICKEEALLIEEKQIPVIWDREIASNPDWINKAIDSISTRRVFITIDLDGISPGIMPGVGTPEPGGLSWYGLLAFLRKIFQTHQVIGCDVMELAPVVDAVVSQFVAAKLVYKTIGYQAESQGWYKTKH